MRTDIKRCWAHGMYEGRACLECSARDAMEERVRLATKADVGLQDEPAFADFDVTRALIARLDSLGFGTEESRRIAQSAAAVFSSIDSLLRQTFEAFQLGPVYPPRAKVEHCKLHGRERYDILLDACEACREIVKACEAAGIDGVAESADSPTIPIREAVAKGFVTLDRDASTGMPALRFGPRA